MINKNDFFLNIESEVYKELFKSDDIIEVMANQKDFVDEVLKDEEEFDNSKNPYTMCDIKGKVKIGENVKIASFVTIEGPVIIGDNVQIGSSAYIRPYTIIGNNVIVEHNTQIKNSIIMDNAKIATNVFVGDSIIGHKARVGSGTITANRRFDQGEIFTKDENGNKKATGKKFFGTLLGDASRLGANVTTLPGSSIEHDTFITPGLVIHGRIKANKIVTVKSNIEYTIVDKEKIELQN